MKPNLTFHNIDIYHDGYTIGDEDVAAAVSKHSQQVGLPNKLSIFSAESKAIFLALDYIATSKHNKYVCSESMSCLKSIANIKLSNPLISQIVEKYHHLSELGIDVIICHLLGNVGIQGNEMADSAAKSALQLPVSSIKIPHSNIRCYS